MRRQFEDVKEWLETISHRVTGAMATKVGQRNDNSQWQRNEGPRYRRQQSSQGQGEDMDRALQNGQVDIDIQDFEEGPSQKICLSISVKKKVGRSGD